MSPAATGGLRQRKKERTRQELAAAALALFVERGYEAVKTEDIAAAVEVSPRTFFRYFAGKEQALWPDQSDGLAEMVAVLGARPPGEPVLDSLSHVVLALASCYDQQRDEMLARFRLLTQSPALRGHLLECLDAWEDGLAGAATRLCPARPDDLRPRLLAAGIVAAFRVAVIAWVAGDGRRELRLLVSGALDSLAASFDLMTPEELHTATTGEVT